MASYLCLAYGHGARVPLAVTPQLARWLAVRLERVPPVERWRRPIVVSLELQGQAPGRVHATALIEDGGLALYVLALELTDSTGHWLVEGVSGS